MSFKERLESRHQEHEVSKPESLDLARCAQLIAVGQIPFPSHLPSDEVRKLAIEVLRLRRERFVRYIAGAIACDIHESAKRNKGT
jgi:hypothetical protein